MRPLRTRGDAGGAEQLDPTAQVRIERSSGAVEVTSEQPRAALAQAIVDEGYRVEA